VASASRLGERRVGVVDEMASSRIRSLVHSVFNAEILFADAAMGEVLARTREDLRLLELQYQVGSLHDTDGAFQPGAFQPAAPSGLGGARAQDPVPNVSWPTSEALAVPVPRVVVPPADVVARPPTAARLALRVTRGVALIVVGFVLWALLTTSARERGAQRRMTGDVANALAAPRARASAWPTGVAGLLEIKSIGMRVAVLKGTRASTLASGPGFVAGSTATGMPAVIAGHRTVYGGPLRGIGSLHAGDSVVWQTQFDRVQYVVAASPAREARVHAERGDRVVLVSADPPYAARALLVVRLRDTSEVTGTRAIAIAVPARALRLGSLLPSALITALLGAGWAWRERRRPRGWGLVAYRIAWAASTVILWEALTRTLPVLM
jgi:sortase (surface protein transpeptidase)